MFEDYLGLARQGRPWGQWPIKQELNRNLPVEDAFLQFRDLLKLPSIGSLRRVELGSASAEARNSKFYKELEPAGIPYVNEPPRVLGEGNHRRLSAKTRTVYLTVFENAAVCGRSVLIEHKGKLLADIEGNEFVAGGEDAIDLDLAIFRRDGDWAWLVEPTAESEPLRIDSCFSLLSPNSFAFGHWIADIVPRLVMAFDWGAMPDVTILVDHGMPRQHGEILSLLLPQDARIVAVQPGQRVLAEKLWFAPCYFYVPINYVPLNPVMNEGYRDDQCIASPDRFARITKAMLDRFDPHLSMHGGPERVYLARKPNSHRKLVNYDAIEAIAAEHGFARIYAEDLDFAKQINIIRNARYITGPEGSAFFLAFFARPGTKACILNHTHTELLTSVTALLEAVGIDTQVVTGPFRREDPDYPHFGNYEIDPETFKMFLKSWLEEPP